jgi:hypothetical protein
MSTSANNPSEGPFAPGMSAGDVARHLELVLDSPMFHTSPRSCQFLRYVVEAAIDGHTDLLKERCVGEKVYGRPPDYDTGQDSIVRVKASEVRRRLAQYYNLHPASPIRIELPPGAYTPVFHPGQPDPPEPCTPPPDVSPPPPPYRGVRWLAISLAILVLAGSLAAWRMHTTYLSDPRDPILCVPTPETYRIYGAGKPALIEALRPRAPGEPLPKLPGELAAQIVAEPGEFLGIGDARALTLLYAFTLGHGKSPQIRLGGNTSFTELRAGPDILIGGFTNHWTLDLTKDARFVFDFEGPVFGIRDKNSGKFLCRKPDTWQPRSTEDCAVVTRILQSKTGNPLLVAAGLDHYGTFGVGEFLTRQVMLEPVLRKLADGWQKKNLQIVFRVEVLHDNVGPPQVLATHVW